MVLRGVFPHGVGKRVLTRKNAVIASVCCLGLLGVAVALRGFPLAPNFRCIVPGVLYGSGQPEGKGLRALKERYGVRTVINLRSAEKLAQDPRAHEERAYAAANGMEFINLSFGTPSPQEQIEKFLAIMKDPSHYPVLVHCAGGTERSGVMIAAYRIRVEGWPTEKALAEMERYGCKQDESPTMWRIVRELPLRSGQGPGEAAAGR